MKTKHVSASSGAKYRDIVIAASLFILFDLCVLVLNFYTSYEIAEDATTINLAGRQRMLSQRMAKTLLQAEMAANPAEHSRALDELTTTYNLFDATLNAFQHGGPTRNTDGTKIILMAVTDTDAHNTLLQAEAIWLPIKQHIQQFADNPEDPAAQNTAILLINKNNLQLLKLMDQFTTRLAVKAQQKAEQLRLFQTVGITLALINFGVLLFHFIRKLRRSDAAIDEARKETDEILTTVNEGFFLVDEQLNLGHQFSSAMQRILKRDIIPGTPFLSLLAGKVSQHTLDTAHEYIKLLFTKRIRENLAVDLNPLVGLEIDLGEFPQSQEIHYLDISFKRVQSDGKITHLLGTITDISKQVALEKSLKVAEARSREEMTLLSKILQSNPLHMHEFLVSTKKLLLSINDMLEKSKTSDDYRELLNQSLSAIHQVKGDASAIGNDVFVSMVHEFEQTLKHTQANTKLTSRDLLPVTIHINTLLAKITTVSTIIDKITQLIPAMTEVQKPDRSLQWIDDFRFLANKISNDLNKKVVLGLSEINLNHIEEQQAKQLRNICIQMIRNAIVHGIESPEQRTLAQKQPEGALTISVIAQYDKTELIIRDDGKGLSLEKIKQSLLNSQRYTKHQLEQMDDKLIIMSIFTSGVTTASEVTEHAGQGVGLTIVKQAINDLGGRLQIGSRPGKYTEFRMTFSNVRLNSNIRAVAT